MLEYGWQDSTAPFLLLAYSQPDDIIYLGTLYCKWANGQGAGIDRMTLLCYNHPVGRREIYGSHVNKAPVFRHQVAASAKEVFRESAD